MNTQVSKIELIEMLLKENNQSSLLSIKNILQNNLESESEVIKIKGVFLIHGVKTWEFNKVACCIVMIF